MVQRPSEISSPVKPVSSPSPHGAPIYKGHLRVGRNVRAVSWGQAGNHQRRHQGLSPQHSVKSRMRFFFLDAVLGLRSTHSLARAPTTRCCNSQETPWSAACPGPQPQFLCPTSNKLPVSQRLQEQGLKKKSLSHETRARTEAWQHCKRDPAPPR